MPRNGGRARPFWVSWHPETFLATPARSRRMGRGHFDELPRHRTKENLACIAYVIVRASWRDTGFRACPRSGRLKPKPIANCEAALVWRKPDNAVSDRKVSFWRRLRWRQHLGREPRGQYRNQIASTTERIWARLRSGAGPMPSLTTVATSSRMRMATL